MHTSWFEPALGSLESLTEVWRRGSCVLRHGIQNSMEAILDCHPALSTEWLDWVAKWCERWRMRTGPIVRDHGWFFKPQLFPIKIILWKRGTFQLSNATKFSSIRQKAAKLQEFKVERLGDQFVTVTMGKSRFDGTKRLAFPPWQRFICIHSDRPVLEIDKGRLELKKSVTPA